MMKRSVGKQTLPGRKQVWRVVEDDVASRRRDRARRRRLDVPSAVPLLRRVMSDGKRDIEPLALSELRSRSKAALAAIPERVRRIHRPEPYRVRFGRALVQPSNDSRGAIRDARASRCSRRHGFEHPSQHRDDLAHGDRPRDDAESKLHVIRRSGSLPSTRGRPRRPEGSDTGLHPVRSRGWGNPCRSMSIARGFVCGSQILPRNRPHIGREDVVSLLGELSPKQRACRPLRAKKHDVGTCRHNGSPGGEIAATPVPLCATVSRIQEANQCESGLRFQSNLDRLHVMQLEGALMDMGETLRMAREQQGLSLDVISQKTKIGTEKLRAIEENDIQRLPSGIFLRGFLRAYAREVGLDVEDTVNRYIAQFESQAAIVEDDTPYEPAEETPVEISESQRIEESLREMSIWGVAAIVVLSLGLLAYMTLRSPGVSPAPTVARAEPPAVAPPPAFARTVPTAPLPPDDVVPLPLPSESASAVTPPAPDSATTVTLPPTPVTAVTRSVPEETGTAGVQEPAAVQSSNTIELTIETVGPCWVEAIVDGQNCHLTRDAGRRASEDRARQRRSPSGRRPCSVYVFDQRCSRQADWTTRNSILGTHYGRELSGVHYTADAVNVRIIAATFERSTCFT